MPFYRPVILKEPYDWEALPLKDGSKIGNKTTPIS